MRRPTVSQPASAASIRPGSSSTGRVPTKPSAVVSPGVMPMPWNCDPADAGQRAHARVVASAAGAADGDDGVGAVVVQRGFERDVAGDRRSPLSASMALAISVAAPRMIVARAGAHDAHARLADQHALDAERGAAAPRRSGAAARRRAAARSPAVGVGVRRQHAVAGRDRGERRGLAAAHLHGVERGHRVGAGGQRVADIDRGAARATAAPAHRSWRRCVSVGAHRIAVAQRERGLGMAGRDHRRRRRASARAPCAKASSRGATGPTERSKLASTSASGVSRAIRWISESATMRGT